MPQAIELWLVEPLIVDGNGLKLIAPVKKSAHAGSVWLAARTKDRSGSARRCACERPPRDADANQWRIRQDGAIGKRECPENPLRTLPAPVRFRRKIPSLVGFWIGRGQSMLALGAAVRHRAISGVTT